MRKIIDNILYRWKEDVLVKRTRKVTRKVAYKELEEITSCLVFWTADTGKNIWYKKLQEAFKRVKVDKLCFLPAGIEMLETDDMVVLRNEDLKFKGVIENQRLSALMQKKYDLLIDFTAYSNALIDYVLTITDAGYIVGMKKENSKADIIIDGVTEPGEFIRQLTGILSAIKKY